MAKHLDDMQKLNQTGVDNALKMWGDWSKSWQAITAEMTDYSKRSFEDGAQTMEKLMAARTMEQVMEIQTSYARRAYEEYVQQVTRLSTMYVDIAKDAAKPVERMTQSRR